MRDDGARRDGLVPRPLPPIPAGCPLRARILTYNPQGSTRLVNAFEAHLSPCADYFVFLPALVADKTQPRSGTALASVHQRTGRFHAAAEFHYATWSQVTGMSWQEKGVEFRRRMAAAGYDLARGDTWAINELPTTVRHDATVRAQVRALLRGLAAGPAGAPARTGIVYVVQLGHDTTNHAVYKPHLKDWLGDAAFWQDVNQTVESWGQETYVQPDRTCVAGTTVGEKSIRINEFAEHPARLAQAGGAATAAARTFLNRAYFPLLTAVWRSTAYGQTNISLDAMKHLVSLETYATRAWAGANPYPDGRIGFAWDDAVDGATEADVVELAERLALAVGEAYGLQGSAAKACSPSGAFTWCACSVAGAAFNATWATYESW